MTSIQPVEISRVDTNATVSGTRTAIALLAAGIGIIALLIIPIPIKGRASVACGDLAHAPLFGLIMLVSLLLLRRRFDRQIPLRIVFTVALFVIAFGILIELIQSVSGRMPNVHDAVNNTYGVFAAIAVYFAYACRNRPATALALFMVGATMIGISWRAPITVIVDATKAKWEFPVLATFRSSAELGRFYFHHSTGSLTEQDATEGKYAMQIVFEKQSPDERYPGVRLSEFNPNWSSAESLEFDLVLDSDYPESSIRMMIKVVDGRQSKADGDYFWRWIDLEPGAAQHISVTRPELIAGPETRKLDLRKVRAIDWLVVDPPHQVVVRIDNIHLVPRQNR